LAESGITLIAKGTLSFMNFFNCGRKSETDCINDIKVDYCIPICCGIVVPTIIISAFIVLTFFSMLSKVEPCMIVSLIDESCFNSDDGEYNIEVVFNVTILYESQLRLNRSSLEISMEKFVDVMYDVNFINQYYSMTYTCVLVNHIPLCDRFICPEKFIVGSGYWCHYSYLTRVWSISVSRVKEINASFTILIPFTIIICIVCVSFIFSTLRALFCPYCLKYSSSTMNTYSDIPMDDINVSTLAFKSDDHLIQ